MKRTESKMEVALGAAALRWCFAAVALLTSSSIASSQVSYYSPQAGPPTYLSPDNVGRANDFNSRVGNERSFVRYHYEETPVRQAPPNRPAPGGNNDNVVYTVPAVVPPGGGSYDRYGRPPNNYYDNRRDPRRRYDNRRRPDDRRRPQPPATTTTTTAPDPRRQYPRRGCNCSPGGSVADECDYRGQCHCRPHVIGRACDRCEDSFIALGTTPTRNGECRECDPCYRLLQPEIEKLRRKLAEIRAKIDAGGGGGGSITDTNFEDVLRSVTTFVKKLYEASLRTTSPSSGSLARYRDFQNLLREIRRQVEDIVNRRISLGDQKVTAVRQHDDAKATIVRIEDLLRQLDVLIRRDGRDALDEAKRAEREFGLQSQEMTAMAEESRRLAEQHEQEANGVKATADEALQTSRDAMQLAREAFAKQEETSLSLVIIQREIVSIQSDLDEAKRDAEDLFGRMKDCREEARKVFDQVRSGGGAPSVSVNDVKRRSRKIISTATNLIQVGERLKNQYGPLMESINEKLRTTQYIYDEAVRLQQLLDGLLEEATSAYNIAFEAKAKADLTLTKTMETLRILQNFDDQVQQSKTLALMALEQIPEIERIIAEAEGKTRTANGALVGSGQKAETALNDAAEALRIANGANDGAMSLLPEMRELGVKAVGERSRAEDLGRQVDERNIQLQGLESQADANLERATETERISKAADQAADTAIDKAEDVLADLAELLRKLSEVGVVNPGLIGILKDDLDDVERQLSDMDLDEQLAVLEVGAKQQQVLIGEFTLNLTQLEKDVVNIEDIRASLPPGCYKNIVLEEHGQGGAG